VGSTTLLERGVSQMLVPPDGAGALVGQSATLLALDRDGQPRPGAVDLPILTDGPMALSPDGRLVGLLGSERSTETSVEFPEGRVVVADRGSGTEVSRASVNGDDSSFLGGRLAFSPDDGRLAVGTYGGVLSVLDVASGRVLVERQTDIAAVTALLWSADGRTLYEGGQDGVLRLLDPQTLDAAAEIPLTPQLDLSDIIAVPGTGLLAVSSEAGQVFFVDPGARTVVGEPLAAEATQLQALASSPDGARIAAVSRDGALRLWDRSTGRAIGPPLQAHDVHTLGIAWLDEDRLLTGSLGGSIVAWDMAPEDWVDRACELAGRDLTRAEWARYLPDQPYRRTCSDR
jgi:WD40 repeat protein